MADKLYKYLDTIGGLAMLYDKTLQFTNATQMNDPFECHPVLVDFPPDRLGLYHGIPADFYSKMVYQKGLNYRDRTYICSLTKVYDSILMWSYYNNHRGVCIGVNMEKVRPYLKNIMALIVSCFELEVVYRDNIADFTPLDDAVDFLQYQFATKAKEWQHEQEVRLIAYEPSPMYMRLPPGQNDKEGPIDRKEERAYFEIGSECFESLYLGLNISRKDKDNIIKIARECNPNIKIYQMTIDPRALKLGEQMIEQ